MAIHRLSASQFVPHPVDEVFAFFAKPENLGRITPPSMGFESLTDDHEMRAGLEMRYRIRPVLGIPMTWIGRISELQPPTRFVDVQVHGPYRRWEHTHRLRPVDGGTEICDQVVYRLPYEPLAGMVAPVTVRPWLTAIFDYRARQTEASLR